MQFDKAYSFLMHKLENELPKNLYYHNASHTKDVLEYAQLLAESENISEPEFTLLKTACETIILKLVMIIFKNTEFVLPAEFV